MFFINSCSRADPDAVQIIFLCGVTIGVLDPDWIFLCFLQVGDTSSQPTPCSFFFMVSGSVNLVPGS
jgi:hypothetical protein